MGRQTFTEQELRVLRSSSTSSYVAAIIGVDLRQEKSLREALSPPKRGHFWALFGGN